MPIFIIFDEKLIRTLLSRIIGIDVGRKRVGFAVTDPLQIIASPLDTVANHLSLTFIENYCKNEDVEAFAIGLPKTLDNKPSESTIYLKPFVKKLELMFPSKKIHFIDERFTSKIAMQTMIDGGMKKKDRRNKATVDTISAVLILQSYLEQKNNNLL